MVTFLPQPPKGSSLKAAMWPMNGGYATALRSMAYLAGRDRCGALSFPPTLMGPTLLNCPV